MTKPALLTMKGDSEPTRFAPTCRARGDEQQPVPGTYSARSEPRFHRCWESTLLVPRVHRFSNSGRALWLLSDIRLLRSNAPFGARRAAAWRRARLEPGSLETT